MLLDQPCKQTEFAELVGTTKQAINQHVAAGNLKEGEPAGVWLVAYCEQLRKAASGREINTVRQQLEMAKTREALASAETKELELAKAKSLILDADQVEHAMCEWIGVARESFINSVDKIIEMVESQHGIDLDRDKINAITESATRVIGNYGG